MKKININEDIIKQSIEHYGTSIQATVCMEELSELIQQISKQERGCGTRENLVEEIADVYIVLNIIKHLYAVDDADIQNQIDHKQHRLVTRMKK